MFVFTVAQRFGFAVVGERLTKQLRELSFKSFLRQNMGWYDEELNQPRLLGAKLATEAAAVKGAAIENIGMTMQVRQTCRGRGRGRGQYHDLQ
jgi:ATP-binding cassette subfamily B (MDR/TAP) protein 1